MNNTLTLNHLLILKPLKWPITFRLFLVFSILSIIALLIFYIFQVNIEISQRYLIQNYKEKIDDISKENQDLEIETIQTNSLNKVVELIGPLNFEKADKIYYIRILNKQVVTK